MKKLTLASINSLLGQPSTIYGKFHSRTKLKSLTGSDSNLQKKYKRRYKEYPRLEKIFLPEASEILNSSLKETILKRKSSRSFSQKKLSLEILSTLLLYSSYHPSAGGRYPLEIYFLSLNSELQSGLYHYNIRNHSMEVLRQGETISLKKYFDQEWIKTAGGVVIITSVFTRNTEKYGDRGYRAILQEVGYLGELIYLMSSATNIGCCAIGGFVDEELEKLLDIDGVYESVVGVFAVGCI